MDKAAPRGHPSEVKIPLLEEQATETKQDVTTAGASID